MLRVRPSEIDGVVLTGKSLTIDQVVAVARFRVPVSVAPEARDRVRKCRAMVDHLVSRGVKVYGLTTGFGSKRDVFIDPTQTIQLQANLIRSHSAGLGDPFPEDITRAVILLRANTLARGNSGIRASVLDKLIDLLNLGIYPFIPSKGSVGASGDLAPLSHLTLILMGDPAGLIHRGEGSSRAAGGNLEPETDLPLEHRRGHRYVAAPHREDFAPATSDTLERRFGFSPVTLEAKEGLALNNGTQVMTAVALLTAYDSEVLIKSAEIVFAASLEALKGVTQAYDPRIHEARPHPGQMQCAANVRTLIRDSEILPLPLNMAALGMVRQQLEQARQHLPLARPGMGELSSAVTGLVSEIDALLQDPWRRIHDGIAQLAEEERARLTSSDRDLRGAQNALKPLKSRLNTLCLALLSAQLPDEGLPSRDCLLDALRAMEGVITSRPRVQDDYSIRCTPQVLGSARDAVAHTWRVLQVEINAATDNPLIFPPAWIEAFDGPMEALRARLEDAECAASVISGGNFHGEPIGMVSDYLKVALCEVGSISERRTAHLVDGHHNQGLPSLLVTRSGLNNGLMIPQYTAAALVSENKVLAHPATVDSIPTCENTDCLLYTSDAADE